MDYRSKQESWMADAVALFIEMQKVLNGRARRDLRPDVDNILAHAENLTPEIQDILDQAEMFSRVGE